MGCDIHSIIEIKRNGKWEYIEELPPVFDDRCYGVFSILNRNVRNSNNRDGFEGKGLPSDLSGRKFRFCSERAQLEFGYNKTQLVCYIESEQKYISPYDSSLKTEIDFDLYKKLKNKNLPEQDIRYFNPVITTEPETKYFVQDANKLNGVFKNVPFKEIYKTIDEFNNEFYAFSWNEEEKDYGYYDVDFDSKDLHSASYLTLRELKTKVIHFVSDKTFIVDTDFINCLKQEIYEMPDTMICKNLADNKTEVSFVIDAYDAHTQERYNKGVIEIEEIKKKYNIIDDDDIRIVFAFDS